MSKVRINDLAREMEVKSRQILDVLAELGLGEGKTHSSSIEDARSREGSRALPAWIAPGGPRVRRVFARLRRRLHPKIDLSHVSKPGDVMKAILAKKQEEEAEARRSHVPPQPARCRRRSQGSGQAGAAGGSGGRTARCARAARAAEDCAASLGPRPPIVPPAAAGDCLASRRPAPSWPRLPLALQPARPAVTVVPPQRSVVKPPAHRQPPGSSCSQAGRSRAAQPPRSRPVAAAAAPAAAPVAPPAAPRSRSRSAGSGSPAAGRRSASASPTIAAHR